eukprot:361404-Amphidinium_carterae.3
MILHFWRSPDQHRGVQVCADHVLAVEVADFVAAFFYARLPPQRFVSLLGVRVVELLGEIYGLSSAPKVGKESGIKIHPMSASVFALFEPMKVDDAGKVDDMLMAGKGVQFKRVLANMKSKFNFG